MNESDNILVICAHNDDQIIGVGGTIAKYSQEGKKIKTIIFSFGESSHPHLKKEIIRETRVKESNKADKILGIESTVYLGLKENNFVKEIKEKNIKQMLINIINEEKPTKVFTHSIDDPHPDHQAVYKLVKEISNKIKLKTEFYSFLNVWGIFNFRKRTSPKLVVDISDTFKTKIKAFKAHKSQKATIWTLSWNLYFQALMNGFETDSKYAEVFYKIK